MGYGFSSVLTPQLTGNGITVGERKKSVTLIQILTANCDFYGSGGVGVQEALVRALILKLGSSDLQHMSNFPKSVLRRVRTITSISVFRQNISSMIKNHLKQISVKND